ncbi:uncharacterized protein LOC119670006 [Teleopsis dalmanni]|uniref:uncharacterized protein LOC119670006 n=1 Tax=Teleopsis dalmanni TaxID=139649 RepID=UPI0018CF30DB|nr:uncharacterized protein LOC119670006 [Teleopsis dalmanni]
MSLVAYAASSDEDSDTEEDSNTTKAIIPQNKKSEYCSTPSSGHISDEEDDFTNKNSTQILKQKVPDVKNITLTKPNTNRPHHVAGGHISDEDDDFTPESQSEQKQPISMSMSLPKPKNLIDNNNFDVIEVDITPTFTKLPTPRASDNVVVEEDDEFLHKKAQLMEPSISKPPPVSKTRVKITIPSLKEFNDVGKDTECKVKNKSAPTSKSKSSGLLSILPTAKSEQNFRKTTNENESIPATKTSATNIPLKPAFIPDAVKHGRPAANTEYVDGAKAVTKKDTKLPEKKKSIVDCSDSEASDDENSNGDFFSLNTKQKLPQVSTNEINAMVAKRAAEIAEATTNYLKSSTVAEQAMDLDKEDEDELKEAQKRYHDQELDREAIQALVGSNAKRRRQHQNQNIQVVELSSEQVLPNREEWMRTALASSTTYQPRGELVDEEPVAGTRRKHQITYLAHKAKANEAELQAMWATNRQNRRATQSKYGF